jgi:hypothetical protein
MTSRSRHLLTHRYMFLHVFQLFPLSMLAFEPLLTRETNGLVFEAPGDPETRVFTCVSPFSIEHAPCLSLCSPGVWTASCLGCPVTWKYTLLHVFHWNMLTWAISVITELCWLRPPDPHCFPKYNMRVPVATIHRN